MGVERVRGDAEGMWVCREEANGDDLKEEGVRLLVRSSPLSVDC